MAQVYEILTELNSPVYGRPEYDGLEYDYEVPNEMVVASPGGASDIHHHWTKGFYGLGGSSWDVFGNEPPAEVYGNVGALYDTGPTATQTQGPPIGPVYPSPPVGTSPEFLGAQAPPRPPPEPFNNDNNIEYVDASIPFLTESSRERYATTPLSTSEPGSPGLVAPRAPALNWYTLSVLFVAFIAFSFWTYAIEALFRERVYKGRRIPWLACVGYALCFSIVLVGITWTSSSSSA